MRQIGSGFSALLAVLALGACVVEESLAEEDQEIVNGQPTTGYPSVVRVFPAGATAPTASYCTGVLITSSSVLTAKHCVQAGAVHLTDVFSGRAVVHPTRDLALISTLDKVGRPWHARIATNVAVGMPITLVGYGQISASTPQDGIKRFGSNTIDAVNASFFYFDTPLTAPAPEDAATCFGDSGGPAFVGATDCVGGITRGQLDATPETACTADGGLWLHSRLDVAWLEDNTRDSLRICK